MCNIGELLALCDSFSLSTREFYFDRSPRIFENILGLYRWTLNCVDNLFCLQKDGICVAISGIIGILLLLCLWHDDDDENHHHHHHIYHCPMPIIVLEIRKGELHLTESVCPRDFLGELEYWGLSALHIGHISCHPSLLCTELRLSMKVAFLLGPFPEVVHWPWSSFHKSKLFCPGSYLLVAT